MEGGALLGQMGVRNVVRRQAVRRQAQGARQQLQGVFILGQQRVFSRRRGRGALLRRAVAGRRRFGVVRRRSQRNEAQSVRVALRRQQVGQFGGAGLRVFGPFDADDYQALQRSAGEVKWLRVVQLRKDVDGLLADHQRHAFVHGDVEVNQPGALTAEQGFRLARVQPVGRQRQFVRDAFAPNAKHLAPPRRVADGAPAVGQQHRARCLGFGADRLDIGETRRGAVLAELVKVVGRGRADHPGRPAATEHQRQVARDAFGVILVTSEAGIPVIHAALQFVAGQRVGVLDRVEVVRVDTHAQSVRVRRREIARFKPHRQQRDRLSAV